MSDPYVEYQVGATPEDAFVVPFQFWEKADLYVEVGGSQELNFNIIGAGDPQGGTIILVTPVTNTLVSIQRFTTVLRITDFPIAGPFRIEALNDEFDHIYAILQDLEFFQDNVTIPWENITNKPRFDFTSFLVDTPDNYWSGSAGKLVRPNDAETGLIFDNTLIGDLDLTGKFTQTRTGYEMQVWNRMADGSINAIWNMNSSGSQFVLKLNNNSGTDFIFESGEPTVPNFAPSVLTRRMGDGRYLMVDTDYNHMVWRGEWLQQTYEKNEVVLDWPYTMIANKQTDDRPAPQPAGNEQPVYTGDSPTAVLTNAKTLLVANTYTLPTPLIVTQARVYTVTGNFYSVYVKDNSTGVIDELRSFIADETGWVTLPTLGNIIPEGSTFDLGCYVQEPDPTPTIFFGDWNYSTPNNSTVPLAGQATQSDKEKNEILFHKTDADSVDRSAELATVEVGDTIASATIRWSVSAIVDNGSYITFTVAPQTQIADGLARFDFETVSPTPITTMVDPDYYMGNAAVAPYYSVDSGPNLGTDDALGVDIVYQTVKVSPDWDIVSTAGASGTGGEGGGGASITMGDTFPDGVSPGHLHYKTSEYVGLYVWYNDGSSDQWVQTNGAVATAPEDTAQPILPVAHVKLQSSYSWASGNMVTAQVTMDELRYDPNGIGTLTGNQFVVAEDGVYRVWAYLRWVGPTDGARTEASMWIATNGVEVGGSQAIGYNRNITGVVTNISEASIATAYVLGLSAGDPIDLRLQFRKEDGNGPTVGHTIAQAGTHMIIERIG